MGRRRKQVIESVLIEGVAAEGKCIAKHEGMVIFTKGLVPGDVADLLVTKKKKQFMEARPLRMIKYSEERVKPFCQHYGICGGCKWQHLPYTLQLKYKQQQVKDNFERIAKVAFPEISSIIGSEKSEFYRNKLEFTFSNSRWLVHDEISSAEELDRRALGFHVSERFDRIVDIEKCYLQESPSNEIRNFVKAFSLENNFSFYDVIAHKGLLRNLIIRTSSLNETMVIVQFGENDTQKIKIIMDALNEKFPEITSLNFVVNTKKNDTYFDLEVKNWKGRDHILEKLGKLTYKISSKSFFQTNSQQAEKLYEKTKEFAGLTGNEVVYDLYTGTGTIANYVAGSAKTVIGIESIDQAIEDAKENSRLNNIPNTDFLTGDAKDLFGEATFDRFGRPDVLITDPPRAGMHPDIIEKINQVLPAKIVYVSCNPATQARDLALLDAHYKVAKVQPVDMFPHTHHVECVVLLELRK